MPKMMGHFPMVDYERIARSIAVAKDFVDDAPERLDDDQLQVIADLELAVGHFQRLARTTDLLLDAVPPLSVSDTTEKATHVVVYQRYEPGKSMYETQGKQGTLQRCEHHVVDWMRYVPALADFSDFIRPLNNSQIVGIFYVNGTRIYVLIRPLA